jgi:hypothetical protein
MLVLNLPPNQPTPWVAETSREGTLAWLGELSRTESSETARELYQSLYTLNRQKLAPHQRFELMELYRNPVAAVLAALRSELRVAGMPLSPAQQQLAGFLRTLTGEMAIGYKAVIAALPETSRKWFGPTVPLATVIERALRYLGETLLQFYQVYMPIPPAMWREVHGLYELAERRGLVSDPVPVALVEAGRNTSIGERYRQLCLLALCNSYQLPLGEVARVYSFLYEWSHELVIAADPPAGPCFSVKLDGDAPPGLATPEVVTATDTRRYLDTGAIRRRIQGFIHAIQQGTSPARLALGAECLERNCLAMLQRLDEAWEPAGHRQFARLPQQGDAAVCVGLRAAHFFVNGQRGFEPPDPARWQPLVMALTLEHGAVPAPSETEEYLDLSRTDLARAPAPRREPETAPGDMRLTVWRIRDQSAGGLQLATENARGARVRVGELVCIAPAQRAGRDWWVGGVRWIRAQWDSRLEVGIELIAPDARPIAVSEYSASPHFVPALFLPAIETEKNRRPASLLVPRGVVRSGLDLLVADDLGVRVVRPFRHLGQTAAYEHLIAVETSGA